MHARTQRMHTDENIRWKADHTDSCRLWALVAEYAKLRAHSMFNNKLADLMNADARHLKLLWRARAGMKGSCTR